MSVSAVGISRTVLLRRPTPTTSPHLRSNGVGGLVIECSSRPNKKATAHHKKTRPKKTQPWDIRRRGPTFYPPLPPLPAEWTLVSDESAAAADAGAPPENVAESG